MSSMLPSPHEEWLQRGQSLEAEGRLAEAIAAYDHALTILRLMGNASHEATRRALGIVWMNRGNVLQKTNDSARHAEAIRAYDEAIAAFRSLPLETEPLFRNHLGAAWLNRGHALLVVGDAEAIRSFEHAIAEFAQLPIDSDPHFRLNLAGARTNLAHALLATDSVRARAEAQGALALLDAVDRAHPAFAEMSLRARRALVMAIGPAGDATLLAESTDAIDDGLALARHWETRGVDALRPLAARLFRLGAQLYRTHQPQFLAEFVLENLSAGAFGRDPGFRAAAEESLRLALAELQQPRILTAHNAAALRLVEIARSLRDAQRQLSTLSPPLSPPPA